MHNMEHIILCRVCLKPLNTSGCAQDTKFNQKPPTECSQSCEHLLQFFLGLAHGITLITVVNMLCLSTKSSGLQKSSSVSHTSSNIGEKNVTEAGLLDVTKIKQEPLEVFIPSETEIPDVKVFFDENLGGEPEASSVQVEDVHLNHRATRPPFSGTRRNADHTQQSHTTTPFKEISIASMSETTASAKITEKKQTFPAACHKIEATPSNSQTRRVSMRAKRMSFKLSQWRQCGKETSSAKEKQAVPEQLHQVNDNVEEVNSDAGGIVAKKKPRSQHKTNIGNQNNNGPPVEKTFVHVNVSSNMTSRNKKARYRCDICGAGFVYQTSKKRHMNLHTRSGLQCTVCSRPYTTAHALNYHMLDKHQKGRFFNNRLATLEEVGYAVDREATERHLNQLCVVCGSQLTDGICQAHPLDFMLSFTCSHCEFVAKHVNELCQHLKTHNIPLAFTASTGNYTVASTNKQDEADSCPICQKVFFRAGGLTAHMQMHAEKTYACPICSQKFNFKSSLHTHLRTHSDSRPFQCEVCQKAFKCKQQLTNHRLLHNLNASPYKCHLCGKAVTRKYYLKRHYAKVHPDVNISI